MDVVTGVRALWSEELEEVATFIHPSGERVQVLPLEVETVELDVVVRYPEGYDERLAHLLRAPKYRREGKLLVQHFPDAEQHPDSVRRGLSNHIRLRAKQLLAATDWVVIRQIERGTAAPEEITRLREAARKAEEADQRELDRTPDTGLRSFTPKNLDGVLVQTEKHLESR